MKITKYICTNILSLFGLFLLSLFLIFIWTDIKYNGTSTLHGVSLLENSYNYISVIVILITSLTIEALLSKILNKYVLNFQIKNIYLHHIYNALFWIGFSCSIIYLALYIYIIAKL